MPSPKVPGVERKGALSQLDLDGVHTNALRGNPFGVGFKGAPRLPVIGKRFRV